MTEHRPGAARRALGRCLRALHPSDWVPGRHNVALLVIQLVALYQAALRGRDYLTPRTGGEVEIQGLGIVDNAAALSLWGWLFYVSAVIALIGLAGRWAPLVIGAHCALFAWYGGVGVGLLQAQGVEVNPSMITGGLCAIAGTWIVFRREATDAAVRLLVGVPGMLVGQELLSTGLVEDYRTGTGLMGAGIMHLTIAAGIWLLWKRQRLVEQVEREQGVVLPGG